VVEPDRRAAELLGSHVSPFSAPDSVGVRRNGSAGSRNQRVMTHTTCHVRRPATRTASHAVRVFNSSVVRSPATRRCVLPRARYPTQSRTRRYPARRGAAWVDSRIRLPTRVRPRRADRTHRAPTD
jgi:hypothetical protein